MHICRKSRKPALSHKGPSARELCAQPQPIDRGTAESKTTKKESKKVRKKEMKKERRKGKKGRKKMPQGMRWQCDKWQTQTIRTTKPFVCSALLCRNVTRSPYHGELLLCMRQEAAPLGFCFLLIRVPTDCLCPHANRISHASFPMVFCPVLASWWMENHTEERGRAEVCPASVRQQGQF